MTNVLPDGYLIPFDHGVWKHTAPPMDYGGDYWQSYIERDATPMGKALTDARVELVRKHFGGAVVDIGIGGGRFVTESGGFGFDINPKAIEWLKKCDRFVDPYASPVEAVTCWDSLEHIPEPEDLLANVADWLFVSLPIFDGFDHIKESKHYKPGEHIWYFTDAGFRRWLSRFGFEVIAATDIESQLGREGIMSYAAKRVST